MNIRYEKYFINDMGVPKDYYMARLETCKKYYELVEHYGNPAVEISVYKRGDRVTTLQENRDVKEVNER